MVTALYTEHWCRDASMFAVRRANMTNSPHVIRTTEDGTLKDTPVTNLGWILRACQGRDAKICELIAVFRPVIPSHRECVVVFYLEDGTVYATPFASKSVLADWLDRPTFRDVPILWQGVTKPE